MKSHIELGTWDPESVPLPHGQKAVGCRFLFKDKFDTAGIYDKSKARLIALGHLTIAGIHYIETFAPVASAATMRLMMVYALLHCLDIEMSDVCTAYLCASLPDNVPFYLKSPPGMTLPEEQLCYV